MSNPSPRRFRVLQVNKLYYPVIGGIEQVAQILAEGLRDRLDMRVLVCNTGLRTVHEEVNGVPVTRAGSLGRFLSMPVSFAFFGQFRRARRDAELLQVHVPFPLSDLAALLFWRGPIVVWWHSEVVRQRAFAIVYAPLLRRLLARADRIIGATPHHLKPRALASHQHKCVVIPYGTDIRRFDLTERLRAETEAIRAQYGNPLLLFVGRLVYYKGVDVLVRAMADVAAKLIIVGSGPLEPSLRDTAEKLGIADRIVFLGAVANDKLPELFHACDLFVLPSVAASEAFGLVQIEAMACGKPVINTDLPTGVPWVSINEETGLTVPAGDSRALASAINRLLEDPALRAQYGRAARARAAQHFDLGQMLDSVFALYQELCAASSSRL